MKAISLTGLENLLENSSTMDEEELSGLVAGLETMMENVEQRREILAKKGEDAQHWLDLLQLLADSPAISSQIRSTIFTVMIHLSRNSGCCPKCLVIQNVEKQGEHPVGGGGFGDVYKGTINQAGSIRVEYLREAIVWKQVKHPNVLPFLGIYYLDDTRQRICLVSPWMERGNLVQYLRNTPRESVDHLSLVFDVASGLSHLHMMKIVHADLKGVNILMTPEERACIGDFGLSRISDTNALRLSSPACRGMGTVRWLAPELFAEDATTTKESDVYAFGCVCYEIFTGLLPLHELKNDGAVICGVASGTRPSRPEVLANPPDAVWDMMEVCWKADPAARPTAATIVQDVAAMKPTPVISAPAWDDSIIPQVWNKLERSAPSVTRTGSVGPVRNRRNSHPSKNFAVTGAHIRWIRDQRRRQRDLSHTPKTDADGEENLSTKPLDDTNLLSPRNSGPRRARSLSGASGGSGSYGSYRSDSYASTSSSILMRYFPKRFFVSKMASLDMLAHSVDTGVWTSQNESLEDELERASRTSSEVFLIVAVEKKNEFWGYAKMAGTSQLKMCQFPSPLVLPVGLSEEPPQIKIEEICSSPLQGASSSPSALVTVLDDAANQATSKLPVPANPPRSPTHLPPISGDETPRSRLPNNLEEPNSSPILLPQRPQISVILPHNNILDTDATQQFVESPLAISDEEDPLGQAGDVVGGISKAGCGRQMSGDRKSCSRGELMINWICTDHLPYNRTRHIRNPWDHDREVMLSNDGHELEPGVGQQLIDEWQRFVVEQRA
ncbi:Rho guanine nucleotide exchange factor, partial [Marasmius sp. AFHP31]